MVIACYRLRGVLVAETPLHIGSGSRTGVIKHSRICVPGSFIRGAFGTCLMRLEGDSSEIFQDLFGEEFGKASKMFFKHSYPLHIPCGDGVYLPAPKTVYRCSNRQCMSIYDTFKLEQRCSRCGGDLKPFFGFRCSKCGNLEEMPLSTSSLTLTAVDRERQSYAEIPAGEEVAGTLHVLELIERGARFGFQLVLDRDCERYLAKIRSILERCVPDEGIGGSKSRGLGKIVFDKLGVEEVTDEMIKKRAESIKTDEFSVQLLSPMVLEDAQKTLEPGTLLEGCRRAYTWCFRQGKPSLPEVSLEKKRAGIEMFSGWSLKKGSRRRIEPALSPGSSFLFRCSERSEPLNQSLAALEYCAIGAYKPHGCGQLKIRGEGGV